MNWQSVYHERSPWSKIHNFKFQDNLTDEPNAFWRRVLESDDAKTELFGFKEKQYVWRSKGKAFKLKNTPRL